MHPQLETSLALVETVSQKLYLSGIGYYCLFQVYLEEQLPFDIRDNVFQRLLRTCFTSAEDDQIIGISDILVSSSFQFMIQLIQHDVTKHRTERPSLRYTDLCVLKSAPFHCSRSEILVDEGQYPSILDIPCQYFHQLRLVHGIKELLQVHIHRPHSACFQILPAFPECVMGASLWSEPVACFRKLRFIDRCQHLCDCLLDDTVYCCWNSQFSCLSVVLGYLYPSDWLRLVFTSQYGLPDLLAVVSEILQKFIHFHPIDTACAFVLLYPFVCTVQILCAYDFLQHSIPSSVGIGGVVFSYPLVNKRSAFSFVFRTISQAPAIATAMFCAFFRLDFGNIHLLPPPRVPPFPCPSTDTVLWIHLTPHG